MITYVRPTVGQANARFGTLEREEKKKVGVRVIFHHAIQLQKLGPAVFGV